MAFFSGNSSVGRARPCQGRGREFESRFPLHFKIRCPSGEIGRHKGFKIPRLSGCGGSSPPSGTIFKMNNIPRYCGNSSVGRARPCQGRGREFESRFPLHFKRIARVVKSVDTRDLKSLGFRAVAVQVRPRAPF